MLLSSIFRKGSEITGHERRPFCRAPNIDRVKAINWASATIGSELRVLKGFHVAGLEIFTWHKQHKEPQRPWVHEIRPLKFYMLLGLKFRCGTSNTRGLYDDRFTRYLPEKDISQGVCPKFSGTKFRYGTTNTMALYDYRFTRYRPREDVF